MDSSAIRPNNLGEFASLQEDPVVQVEDKTKELDEETLALNYIGNTPAWDYLSKYIDGLVEELDGMVRVLMEQGATFSEIGQKTAVKEITKDYLMRVKEKVKDAMEEVEGANG